ncbi:acyl-CoA thioesterase [Xanthovirga aplysinae]|uniref:acyl-CoA thioesterase n=1 Tax=Xanthovirga aplysinae TaxID=2529853 RepID=UPI0012BCDE41|nr:thioesterase family protein [Xanthovirga aplysinae]MTI31675.1 acyl-CoA thioesterase [Xanthovirga aplysinae]
MFVFEHKIRVRYGETDQMGFVYHGNYALYYEESRTEALRNLGITYKELEEAGIMLPVLDIKSRFRKPARYDDLLTIKVTMETAPDVKMTFHYKVFNQEKVLLNTGETTLVFVDRETARPCQAPDYLLEIWRPLFDEK